MVHLIFEVCIFLPKKSYSYGHDATGTDEIEIVTCSFGPIKGNSKKSSINILKMHQ